MLSSFAAARAAAAAAALAAAAAMTASAACATSFAEPLNPTAALERRRLREGVSPPPPLREATLLLPAAAQAAIACAVRACMFGDYLRRAPAAVPTTTRVK